MKSHIANLTVQRWGNSLAVRIPASMARRAHFQMGTPVEITLEDHGIAVRPTGEKSLTLDERLELFDIERHGTEAMACGRIGVERFE